MVLLVLFCTSWYFFLFLPISSCFFRFLPVSSRFFPFLSVSSSYFPFSLFFFFQFLRFSISSCFFKFVHGSILNSLFKLSLRRPPGTDRLRSPTWCSLLFQRQSHPRFKGGADQLFILSSVFLLNVQEAVLSHNEERSKSSVQSNFCAAPHCPRGSFVPYKSEEQISSAVHSLSCSSLSHRQSRPTQKRGASVSPGPSIGWPCAPMLKFLSIP